MEDRQFELVIEYTYVCKKKIVNSPKIGTIIRQMSDGGYETQNDGQYTYFWHTHITKRPENWKEIKR